MNFIWKTKSVQFCLTTAFCIGVLSSCQQKEAPQKPVTQSKESVIQTSVDRNKTIVADEQEMISNYIKADTQNTYTNNKQGFWYTYEQRQIKDSIRPILGDLVFYTYEISTLTDSILYTKKDIGNLTYDVDKQDILPVLKHSLKFMKKDEVVKAVTPSALAYGFLGDQNKIAKNQPLVFKITLESITKN